MTDELLAGRDISIFLSGRCILKSIDFSIGRGESIGLFGTSGAGKTTLLRAILGFHRIDHGTLALEGSEVTASAQKVRAHANLAAQHGAFYPKLTVRENFDYFAELYRIDPSIRESRIRELIADLKLSGNEDTYAEDLSGGTQKRFEIALSLLNEPSLLILDEPGAGLDVVLKREIYAIIERIRKRGTTVLIASHDLSSIAPLLTHCYIIHDGVISPKFEIDSIDDIESFFSFQVGA